MNLFLILAFLFAVGSVIGWIIEVFYRRFIDPTNPERKWINPGFLNGPYLPIYGFSLIILYLLAKVEIFLPIQTGWLKKLVLFVVMSICITAMEYFTGMIFIVKMKIKLWDYSQNKWNVKGIICPLYSFFWVLLSAFYYFIINPYILDALKWLSENLAFSFVVGFYYGIFFMDLVVSIKDSITISQVAKKNHIVVLIEEVKADLRNKKQATAAEIQSFIEKHKLKKKSEPDILKTIHRKRQ